MLPVRTLQHRDPAAFAIGLNDLRRAGLTPRGLLFVALDPRGTVHLAVPSDSEAVADIRVGDKLSLTPPWPREERLFYYDAIHRLPTGGVLWNGDRRLKDSGNASEVACAIAQFCKVAGAKNVFLGCTPHQPGSWWALDDRSASIALHEQGYVDVTTSTAGLLARRIGEPKLYHLPYPDAARTGLRDGWVPVFKSDLGNILMLERRVLQYRLVLTCERGLIEVDVSGLPDTRESARVAMASGFGVVGRVDGGSFAVTAGTVEPWGLADVKPALLIGAQNETLLHLAQALFKSPA